MKYTMVPHVWDETLADLDRLGHEHVALDAAPDVIIFNGGPDDFPEVPESVQFVQAAFAGVDALDERDVLRNSGVRWANAAGVYDDTVAESAIGLLLAVLHRHKEVRSWSQRPEIEEATQFLVDKKTVAVIGAGGIGEKLIAMLAPFGVNTIAVTRSGRAVAGATESVAIADVAEVWPRADYFIVLAPLTAETRGMLDAEVFRAMKPNAVVVNVARGPLVVTDDLVAAIEAGEIAGAGLDVTDPEPLHDDSPLWDLPTVVITPHTANVARFLRERAGELTHRNWEAIRAGERMHTEVDVERGY